MSQRELAERLGKPRSFVSKVEGKERRLDIVEFIALMDALESSPAEAIAELAEALRRPLEF
ncbi:helix-turn-helix transcriptional regulator [Caulobacter sp. 73W]|uniref:Helix-turn-helix transcriptional regulator n=1 Tax=Caulobacter sp. 73W TaxID=3161137 RepID=A0AB39KQ75_9CAUL